jgi:hypothetical protein
LKSPETIKPMRNDNLAMYLDDHLAGSVAAIEMIEHLIKIHEGKPIEQFCEELCADINSDQNQLRELMRSLEVKESSVRKVGAWVAEKFSRPKFGLRSEGTNEVGFLQALEALVLGIKGKEGLWRALDAVKKSWPQLEQFDFERLEKRAIEQGERVEAKRLEVARQILA